LGNRSYPFRPSVLPYGRHHQQSTDRTEGYRRHRRDDRRRNRDGVRTGGRRSRAPRRPASPDAPAVDVTVDDGALTLFDGFAFGESSGYAVVPADTYEVEVRPDAEDNDGPVVFEADVTLENGSTYTVFALGYLSPDDEGEDAPGFLLLPTEDRSAPPRGGGGGRGPD